MIVEPGFFDHWKTRLLVKALGTDAAPLFVMRLWAHCQQRKAWKFDLNDEALVTICNFNGEATALRDALSRCGFIHVDGTTVVIHDWEVSNRLLVSAWTNGTKPKKKRRLTRRSPTAYRQVSSPSNHITNNSFSVSDLLSALKEGVRGRFQEWVVVRRSMGKAPKDWHRMFKEQVAWLERFTEADQLEILSASIRNNWQGLHEPRHGHVNGTTKPLSTFDIKERLKAIEDELGKTYWDRHKPEVEKRRQHLQQKKKELKQQLTT